MYRHSLWGVLVLIADIWAIVNILQSSADTGKKVLWTVVVHPVAGARVHPVVLHGPEDGKDLITGKFFQAPAAGEALTQHGRGEWCASFIPRIGS